jgi:hypothetical protein
MAGKLTVKEKAFRSELAAANINPDSFLATDYLNHFNEIVMLLEMAVDMPDLMEEAASWKPASYVEHFEGSGFTDRELVIEAWGMTRPSVRACFEDAVEQLDELILSILNTLSEATRPGGAFDDFTRNLASAGQLKMQGHLSVLNGIIHDMPEGPGGDRGDGEFEGDLDGEGSGSSEAQSQDEIDQLFD